MLCCPRCWNAVRNAAFELWYREGIGIGIGKACLYPSIHPWSMIYRVVKRRLRARVRCARTKELVVVRVLERQRQYIARRLSRSLCRSGPGPGPSTSQPPPPRPPRWPPRHPRLGTRRYATMAMLSDYKQYNYTSISQCL